MSDAGSNEVDTPDGDDPDGSVGVQEVADAETAAGDLADPEQAGGGEL